MTSFNRESSQNKWRVLLLLALAELLAMAVWFSASAVVPQLTAVWQLTSGQQAWLTMSVQIGFVIGALLSALFNLADRLPARILLAAATLAAGLTNLAIPLFANSAAFALVMRFLTGVFLAGVYPVGMKIIATWTKKDRGLAIGLMVGALTVGTALPHLLNFFGGIGQWQSVLYLATGLAIASCLISVLFVNEGPYRTKTPPFDMKQIGRILKQRGVVLANLGYLGHMWELYAMWAWLPLFLLESFEKTAVAPEWASVAGFSVIAIGGVGALLAGRLADQFGRTMVTSVSLAISGICSLLIGFLFGANPVVLVVVSLIWGFAVVADSAQFSTAVSELADPEYVGTTLTLQTSLGFLLTLFTIRMIPPLVDWVGWQFAFAFLAIGPVVGLWAMLTLRGSDEAMKLANGRK